MLSAAAALYTGQWLSDVVVDLSPVGEAKFSTSLKFCFSFHTQACVPNLQDFIELVLVLHNQDVGLTVGSHILTSFW